MRYAYLTLALVVALTVSVMGLRGTKSTKPPLEVFPDMDRQRKFKAQAENKLFADGRADRPIPAGVVARGELRADDHLYTGKLANGDFAKAFPAALSIDAQLLARGQERYAIYCSACHGDVGDGNGITKKYGMVATPTYHDERLRTMPVGEIYNTITNGKNTMGAYADKLLPEDRWAVIAYVRALQRAQNASAADVPPSHKKELGL